MLMIEPLPDDPTSSWDDSQTLALREVEQVPGAAVGSSLGRPGLDNIPRGPQSRLSARSRLNSRTGRQPAPQPAQPRPQVKVTLHEAKEETSYTLGAVVGDKAPIRKVYELYGFEPVETPAFEYTDALGKFLPDLDRPNEGVFSFKDDDERWLSLRYDLRAGGSRVGQDGSA